MVEVFQLHSLSRVLGHFSKLSTNSLLARYRYHLSRKEHSS
uniref:Uncharacterized protein n=1 Tax=Siphoviridae sp. ctXZx16 TaxID=2826371 RepID=A0A8S5MKZ3_9CAUD|nr:MAG TPA: hypothetical protein [Siphoviridae sp. ctXZx16]